MALRVIVTCFIRACGPVCALPLLQSLARICACSPLGGWPPCASLLLALAKTLLAPRLTLVTYCPSFGATNLIRRLLWLLQFCVTNPPPFADQALLPPPHPSIPLTSLSCHARLSSAWESALGGVVRRNPIYFIFLYKEPHRDAIDICFEELLGCFCTVDFSA